MRCLVLALLLISSAQGIAAQSSQTPSLRTKDGEPSAPPGVDQVIERAERHFRLGELNLKNQKRQAAREEFDKAVETVLESGYDVRAEPRLQRYYLELVESVYRLETSHSAPAAQSRDTRLLASPASRQAEDYVTAVINHAEAQFELRRVYLRNNKPEPAREAFSKAVEIAEASGRRRKSMQVLSLTASRWSRGFGRWGWVRSRPPRPGLLSRGSSPPRSTSCATWS